MTSDSLTAPVDWVRFWEDSYDARSKIMFRDYELNDWSERAEDYSESRRTNNYEFGESVYSTLALHDTFGFEFKAHPFERSHKKPEIRFLIPYIR